MNSFARLLLILGVGLVFASTGCTIRWVVPVIETVQAGAAQAEDPCESDSGPECEDDTVAEADEEEATERVATERARRTGQRSDSAAADEAEAVARTASARAERVGRNEEAAAVERTAAEREARTGGALADEPDSPAEDPAEEPADGEPDDEPEPEEPAEDEPAEEPAAEEPAQDDPVAEEPADDESDEEPEPEEPADEPVQDEPAEEEPDVSDPPDPVQRPNYGDRRVRVPPGHYPPEGMCRVWYEGQPPGRQPAPAPCDDLLVSPLAPGAFVLYNGLDWDLEHDWETVEVRRPGSVPTTVLQLRRRFAAPRHVNVPRGQHPRDGLCRVWIEGLPPGRQGETVPCETLVGAELEGDAFLLYDGASWAAAYDWQGAAEQNPGSVPEVVLMILGG